MVLTLTRTSGVAKTTGISSVVLTRTMSILIIGAGSGEEPVPGDDPVPDIALLPFRFGTPVEDGDSDAAVFDPWERDE